MVVKTRQKIIHAVLTVMGTALGSSAECDTQTPEARRTERTAEYRTLLSEIAVRAAEQPVSDLPEGVREIVDKLNL